ncbi:uncharacterized protein LOC133179715 [Saccostrea echinata]|uniref:uncharacterized protein LOC133179715 n=1 Tax=Saccostrea echinata TaxID=191078 RepID=UPI002A7F5201|nr:uncharacterized protein LOC133179715 [Saccostrea echinata]
MRGVLCVLLFGVFLPFSGAQRFRGSRRIIRRLDLGRPSLDFSVAGGPETVLGNRPSTFDSVPIETVRSVRVRNARPRSGLKIHSGGTFNDLGRSDSVVNSRGFQLSSDSIDRRRSFFSSINNVQQEITRSRPSTVINSRKVQSGFPERQTGNDVRNQQSAQGNHIVREMQLLNSLLKEQSSSINSGVERGRDQSSRTRGLTEFGTLSSDVQGNVNDRHLTLTPESSRLSSVQSGSQFQPKIVVLRNQNSAKPLNVQIGNTRVEVLGDQRDPSSQHLIQTLRDTLVSSGSRVNNNQVNSIPNSFPNANQNVPNSSSIQDLLNQLQTASVTSAQSNANHNDPNTKLMHDLINQLQGSSGSSTHSNSNHNSIAAALPGPAIINNARLPVTTTASPVPMVTTPLTPSEALRQILGPGVSDTLVKQMAQDILPPELQRLDAILTGQGQTSNTINKNTNTGFLKIGNQTHTFDVGSTKKIKIIHDKHGPRASVTSVNNGSGIIRHSMVTEEPLEYDEILLRKVLQKMNG